MNATNGDCRIKETIIGRHTRAIVLENGLLRAVVLADKGADIYELVYKPRGIDVLWKAPWGLKELGSLAPSAASSQIAWMDHYEGGWQEILPSGGAACTYRGVEMAFHGEIATAPWDYEIVSASGSEAAVRFSIATTRTPFRLERTMSIAKGRPEIVFSERLLNDGVEAMDFMWGHHPAYGAPFLSGQCRLDVPAGQIIAYDQVEPERSWLVDRSESTWPQIVGRDGQAHDLSQIPGPEAGVNNLCCLADLKEGWYGITNTALGFGVGLVWPKDVFPYVWLWEELHGSRGYPWYGRAYVAGIEFWTSYPVGGLIQSIENGTARQLGPGEVLSADFRCVFYESNQGIRRISADGTVETA